MDQASPITKSRIVYVLKAGILAACEREAPVQRADIAATGVFLAITGDHNGV